METSKVRTEKENMIAKDEQNKRAHLPCRCVIQAGEKYCSEACKETGAEEVEIACQCNHEACPLKA